MIIVGLDPGSLITGYGVIEYINGDIRYVTHGVIKNTSKTPIENRLYKIGEELLRVFSQHSISNVVVERIFMAKNADSAFKLGHVRGVAIYAAQKMGAQVAEYAAREVKKGITGYGAAEKEQVRMLVCNFLKIPLISEIDAADALALAIYHTQRIEIDQKFSRNIRASEL